ncbi:hypothetical protein M406DRAFT_353316 [Cryphonectria parasitica EP155]|uniref:MARVEL domain-containing protein n=1 Tax=Cryphonectria parasitica (strain ATCC 38755 / EP155) TaxID=660469 RepID=A0A9P4XW35_CRYP1|nr:uncharacterized protein M406DRAFT_353316 [Cryphonectria parasitica EP155]KAF3761906.1 hypothetical protein M406DRAFT_353316 [Cryphonectria parasitica EP155]
MGRRLSTCLVLLRAFQLLAAFIPGAMNGWLTYYLYANKLGPSAIILVVEILAASVFVYATLSLSIIHTRQRSRRTPFLVCTICLDVVFCFIDITILSLLSFTGLPSNCSGLTTSTWLKGDKPDLPTRGYSTIRFSNEQDGHRGELDKYCSMERGFFFCTVLTILTFIITIILSVIRICENNYTRNSEIQYLLDEREEILKLELKVQEQEFNRSQTRSPAILSPLNMLPPSNILPPAAPVPKFTSDEEAAIEASILASLGRSPNPSSPSSSSTSSAAVPMPSPLSSPSSRFMGAGLPSIPEAAASSSNTEPHIQTSPPDSPSTPDHQQLPSPSSILPIVEPELLDEASEEENAANLAMVSDGSRYSGHFAADGHNHNNHHQLPPYSPGNERTMDGHGSESNEIRLSEYVKGETRAQDMKDDGSFQ